MKDNYILTAESVTAGHPDKLCDAIADNVLDACLKEDPNARVACEVLATAGKILVAGELRTTASPDVEAIVRQVVRNSGYDCNYHVEVRLHTQSPDIAGAVDGDTLGAGDQGIMYGYACWETVELLPAPVVLANRITSLLTTCREEKLISGIGPDGKAQVSVQYAFGVPERVDTIVISCQHDEGKDPDELRKELRRLVIARACHDVRIDEQTKIFINPSGRFVLGGFEADTGLTGRKLMVDTYGGLAPHGGGALSGKDGTKVDRSGAYMARYVAKNIVAAGLADKCLVQLAYAIGIARPVSVMVDTYGTGKVSDEKLAQAVNKVFDLRPTAIIRDLELTKPIYRKLAAYGHMGRTDLGVRWEDTDRVDALLEAVK